MLRQVADACVELYTLVTHGYSGGGGGGGANDKPHLEDLKQLEL